MRCQHNHHRPRVAKRRDGGKGWAAICDCGWRFRGYDWHYTMVFALAHSEHIR